MKNTKKARYNFKIFIWSHVSCLWITTCNL